MWKVKRRTKRHELAGPGAMNPSCVQLQSHLADGQGQRGAEAESEWRGKELNGLCRKTNGEDSWYNVGIGKST